MDTELKNKYIVYLETQKNLLESNPNKYVSDKLASINTLLVKDSLGDDMRLKFETTKSDLENKPNDVVADELAKIIVLLNEVKND
jgi:hypothetical protein